MPGDTQLAGIAVLLHSLSVPQDEQGLARNDLSASLSPLRGLEECHAADSKPATSITERH